MECLQCLSIFFGFSFSGDVFFFKKEGFLLNLHCFSLVSEHSSIKILVKLSVKILLKLSVLQVVQRS